ncbi:MAG: c-type cytochrome [Acidobacteriia bacterium]|nr:c-type cytochrome [Terriglobia bacterium]
MNTKRFVRGWTGIAAPLALATVALGLNATRLAAQAPAGGPPPMPATAANLAGKTAEQFYKKIDALKGIPAAEVHPAMEYITTALGVGCGYCHVPGKFDSDDKHEKNVARSMMKMTMALNNTVFDAKREITCYTCHRGAAKAASTLALAGDKVPTEPSAAEIFPALAVMTYSSIEPDMSPSKAPATVMAGPARPAKAEAPVTLPSVDDVFSKYEEALGGKAAIAKVTSLVHKGMAEMLVPAPPVPQGAPPPPPPAMGSVAAELDVKSPKGVVSVIFPGRGPQMMGFDGTIGWTNAPNREETGGELLIVKELGETVPALEFRKQHTNVKVDAMEKIGDRDVYRVVGTRKEGITTLDRIYFDAQTGLLARTYTTMQSVLGGFPEEMTYEDYRDVSGLKVPFTMRVVSAEGNRTYEWSQVDANAPVDDSKFTRPEPPPPPPARPAAD